MSILLFCLCLICCVIFDWSVLYALLAGLAIFSIDARFRGFAWKEILKMIWEGVSTVKNMLLVFLLIGMLTGVWRAGGTIASIVSYASGMLNPSFCIPSTFVLCCMVSMLTGTAFGTAATMGTICATVARAMGISPVWIGGAVLAGAYFGDRCSPVSTSALLVSQLTDTDIFANIKRMLRDGLVPFLISTVLYIAAGLLLPSDGHSSNIRELFDREFIVSWITLLPAAAILLLSVFKCKVRYTMAASVLIAIPVCIFLQKMPVLEVAKASIMGFTADDAEVGSIMNGGGLVSMVRVTAIVCISSSFSGIFQKTGMLNSIKTKIDNLSARTSPFFGTFCTALVSSAITCNQTLTIILTHQLRKDSFNDKSDLALSIENTAVIIAPLIPWSVAAAVSLASAGAPITSIPFAFFLYLTPLWILLRNRISLH